MQIRRKEEDGALNNVSVVFYSLPCLFQKKDGKSEERAKKTGQGGEEEIIPLKTQSFIPKSFAEIESSALTGILYFKRWNQVFSDAISSFYGVMHGTEFYRTQEQFSR